VLTTQLSIPFRLLVCTVYYSKCLQLCLWICVPNSSLCKHPITAVCLCRSGYTECLCLCI